MDKSGVEIDVNRIKFIDGKIPISEIVPQNLDLSYAIVCVFFGIAILEIVISIILFIFIFIHRNYRAIRQNAPWLTLTMCFAVFTMSLAQLFFSFKRTDTMCYFNLYLVRFGSILLISGLFLKNYRIYLIFSNSTATALNITEKKLFLRLAIYMIIYMAILVAATVSLNYGAVLKYSSKDQYYQYIQCNIPSKTWSTIFEIYLLITLLIPVFGSLILAWLTRKVHSEYRESSALVAFSVIVIITIIIFLPLSLTLGDESDSEVLRYAVFSEYYTVVIFSAFGLMFAPQVYDVLKAKRKHRRLQR